MKIAVDRRGRMLYKNAVVVYPARKGSKLWTRRGVVVDVKDNNKALIWSFTTDEGRPTLRRVNVQANHTLVVGGVNPVNVMGNYLLEGARRRLMRDRFGTEITVGSVVTYPGRAGSNMWMNDAIVIGVEKNTITVLLPKTNTSAPDKKVTIHNLERVTVLPNADPIDLVRNFRVEDYNVQR